LKRPPTEAFKEDFKPTERKLTLKIARSDVARFLARQLSDFRPLQRAVAISG